MGTAQRLDAFGQPPPFHAAMRTQRLADRQGVCRGWVALDGAHVPQCAGAVFGKRTAIKACEVFRLLWLGAHGPYNNMKLLLNPSAGAGLVNVIILLNSGTLAFASPFLRAIPA